MSSRYTSRRDFIKTTALALPLVAAGCASLQSKPAPAKKSANNFVSVRKGRFELQGRPYSFIGANSWYGCYLADAKLDGGRKRMIRELDRLQSLGVTNLRLLAGSETSPLAGAISRGITRAPQDWDEDLLSGLDFCLAEMAGRNMRAILHLSNYWQWSGGFAQYVSWATGDTIPDPDKPVMAKGNWSGFIRFSARFYVTPAANQLYLDYIAQLIRRRNTVNYRIYRDDPVIMTWELANEPRPGADAAVSGVPEFCRWVDATARFIHAQDPNHLGVPAPKAFMAAWTSPRFPGSARNPSD